MEFIKLIIKISIAHGIFLGSLLFFKRKEGRSLIFLSLIVFVLVYMSIVLLLFLNNKVAAIEIYFIVAVEQFVNAPLYYFFIKSVTEVNFKFNKTQLVHFIPGFILFLLLVLYFGIKFPLDRYYHYIAFTPHFFMLIYAIFALVLLIKKRNEYYDWMLTLPRKVFYFGLVFVAIHVIIMKIFFMLVSIIYNQHALDHILKNIMVVIAFTLAGVLYFWGYFMILHPVFFTDKIDYQTKNGNNNFIGEDETSDTYAQLKNYMETQKPYMDSGLTLFKLAALIDFKSSVFLSHVIKKHEELNYYDYINKYRILEVKRYLDDPDRQHLSILELAYEAGFNSKATFNRVFKEKIGVTPKEYRVKSSL